MERKIKLRRIAFIVSLIFTIISAVFSVVLITLKFLIDYNVIRVNFQVYDEFKNYFNSNFLFYLISFAWVIPMVIYIKRIRNDTKNHMLLAVCALLFLGLVPGILLIISETSTNETKRTVKKVKTKSTKSSKNR